MRADGHPFNNVELSLEKSKLSPLEPLGLLFPCSPRQVRVVIKRISDIGEGLVVLRGTILDFSDEAIRY